MKMAYVSPEADQRAHELVDEINAIRLDKKLYMHVLADLAGVSPVTVQSMFVHRHEPRLRVLLQVLDAMGYTLKIEKK